MILIDPPAPIASLAEWEEFLRELKSIDPETAEDKASLAEYVAEAEGVIATLTGK